MTDSNNQIDGFMKNELPLDSRQGLPNMNKYLVRDVIEHFGGEEEFLSAYIDIDEFGVIDGSGIHTEPAQVSWFFGDSKSYLLKEVALICQKSAKNPKRNHVDCIFNGLKGEFSRAEIEKAIEGIFDFESEQNGEHTLAQTKVAKWVVYTVMKETCSNFKDYKNLSDMQDIFRFFHKIGKSLDGKDGELSE